ncbi:MAG: hypothetical protein DRP01_06080 [Archaeoglobales archaeon]|nr:MAG: hypothetical protein DRP01_06080 [Archaeoglobales archaeon]
MVYEKTVAFQLWVKRYDISPDRIALQGTMILPITGKQYKVTLKNVKVYVDELMRSDESIIEVQIDRVNSVGVIRRKGESE